ncbi:MAG: DUF2065 domain-containing protein [Sneathiella sp.]|nr:DUF2065 domain-containing protein [Sneathiella sp.]
MQAFFIGVGILWDELLLAGALVLFIEGALYTLFPNLMKRMILSVLSIPSQQLRISGLVLAAVGVLCAWLLKN